MSNAKKNTNGMNMCGGCMVNNNKEMVMKFKWSEWDIGGAGEWTVWCERM